MTLQFELYWSFRSPYSYLATSRIVELQRDYDLTVGVRPVYPLAVRTPEFFERASPMWVPYLMRDTLRVADMWSLPYRWPRPDPVQMDRNTGKYPKEQPYIHRLTRLGVAAVERGKGLPFLDEISRLIWSGTVTDWHLGDHMAQAAVRAGLDLGEMDAAITAAPERYEAAIDQNQKAQTDAGHWGVPLMVFKGEPFFGQDRLDALLWRMQQQGLQKRA